MDTTKYSYIIIEVQKLSKYINPTNVAEAENTTCRGSNLSK